MRWPTLHEIPSLRKEVSPIQFDLKTLLERKEYRLAHDLACERLATPGVDIQEQAECALIACFAAARSGDEAEAVARGEQAYTLARIAGDYGLLGQAIYDSAHAYNQAGLYAKALERISEFEAHKTHYTVEVQDALEAEAIFARGVVHRNLNQLEEAREPMQTAYELATQRGLAKADEYRSNLIYLLLRQGDTAAAYALIQAGDEWSSNSPEAQALHDLRQLIDRAHYSVQIGATGAAYDLCVEALAGDPPPDLRAQILKLLHDLALATDQAEEALGLALLAVQAAGEAGRRDLLAEAEESALALAQRLSPAELEQMLAQLRSVTVA